MGFLLLHPPSTALALSPGDLAPDFDLPSLNGSGRIESFEIFDRADLTVLILWNRGCPRCTRLALACGALAESLRSSGTQVVGILFGPDDPSSLADLLQENAVGVPHLWDADAGTASAYDLGLRHLGIFLIDRRGVVLREWDDEVPDLIQPVLPAVRAVQMLNQTPTPTAPPPPTPETPRSPGGTQPGSAGAPSIQGGTGGTTAASPRLPTQRLPSIHLDGRARLLSSEGAYPGDHGLFGEELERGTLLLWRSDLRLTWTPVGGIEITPWLRLGNEDEATLTQGAEQFSSARGTLSVRAQRGRVGLTLGAFPVRMSPLLLQRWDAEDAPPLGGVSGCGCGGGGPALSQKSLEILGPDYTLEGASARVSHRYARIHGFVAVPRWEKTVRKDAPLAEKLTARYRRVLEGAVVDLGPSWRVDPQSGLSSPVGLRFGYLNIGDDRRTYPPEPSLYQPEERDERGWLAAGSCGPLRGVTAEGEYVAWDLRTSRLPGHPWALRAGLSARGSAGRLQGRGQAYRIRTSAAFDPLYRALTYDPNREGWRFGAALALLPHPGAKRERFGMEMFHRAVRPLEPAGGARSTVTSLTLRARPVPDLLTEGSLVRTAVPGPSRVRPETLYTKRDTGLSLDLRWEGWTAVDPELRVDALRVAEEGSPARTVWQTTLSVRIVS